MTSEKPVRFTLNDGTNVIVKKVANNKYDFELIFSNGSHKTFVWNSDTSPEFKTRRGAPDVSVVEAINKFNTIPK